MQRVAVPDQVLAGRTEGGLDVEREGAKAAAAGALKDGQLEDVLVEVHGDVRAELIGEVVEQLGMKSYAVMEVLEWCLHNEVDRHDIVQW